MRQNTRLTVDGLDNAKDAAEESQWAVQHTMAKGCSKWQSALSWTISGQLASLFTVYFPPGSQWCSFVCSFFPARRSIAVVALAWSLKLFPGRTSSQSWGNYARCTMKRTPLSKSPAMEVSTCPQTVAASLESHSFRVETECSATAGVWWAAGGWAAPGCWAQKVCLYG